MCYQINFKNWTRRERNQQRWIYGVGWYGSAIFI